MNDSFQYLCSGVGVEKIQTLFRERGKIYAIQLFCLEMLVSVNIFIRTLTFGTCCCKFLCVVDFTVRLANQKWVSANFMSHNVNVVQLSLVALLSYFYLFYRR